MITIELPWIDSALLPNRADGRKWQALAGPKKAARRIGYYTALQATWGLPALDVEQDHALEVIYNPPQRPGPDEDNLARAMKPMIDGIAKALGINDYHFNPVTRRRGEPIDGGKITVIIDDFPF